MGRALVELLLWLVAGVLTVLLGVLTCFLWALAEANSARIAEAMKRFALGIAAADRRNSVAENIDEIQDGLRDAAPAVLLRQSMHWPLLAVRASRPFSRGLYRTLKCYADHAVAINVCLVAAVVVGTMQNADPPGMSVRFGSRTPFVMFAGYLLAMAMLTDGTGRAVKRRWVRTAPGIFRSAGVAVELLASQVMCTVALRWLVWTDVNFVLIQLMLGVSAFGVPIAGLGGEGLARRIWPAEHRVAEWRIFSR